MLNWAAADAVVAVRAGWACWGLSLTVSLIHALRPASAGRLFRSTLARWRCPWESSWRTSTRPSTSGEWRRRLLCAHVVPVLATPAGRTNARRSSARRGLRGAWFGNVGRRCSRAGAATLRAVVWNACVPAVTAHALRRVSRRVPSERVAPAAASLHSQVQPAARRGRGRVGGAPLRAGPRVAATAPHARRRGGAGAGAGQEDHNPERGEGERDGRKEGRKAAKGTAVGVGRSPR